MEFDAIKEKVLAFIRERDWEQFHTPKDLAIAIGAETGELLECFQWKTDAEIAAMDREMVADEIADIFAYLVSLSRSMDIAMEQAILDKLAKNHAKYPVEKSHGNAKKYTELV